MTAPALVLILWTGLFQAGATVRIPTLPELAKVVAGGDEVEIERVAARIGAVRLARVAAEGKREERLAALRALSVVESGWARLPELVRLASSEDREIGEAAAKTTLRITEHFSPQMIESEEVPHDLITRASSELLKIAAGVALPPQVRLSALSALGALESVTRLEPTPLLALLTDPDASIRRSAVETLAPLTAAERALEETLTKDASADVASSAAAALCRDVPATSMPKSAAEARAARLGAPARTRLRALALDEKIALIDRADLLGCLRVAATSLDRQVLDQLARGGPETLKRRARSLGGR